MQEMTELKKLIEDSSIILITAGAGMSVDSKDEFGNNLPDFRGENGFWKAYPALGKKHIGFASIANPKSFDTQPELAWGFYGSRYNLYKNTVPHNGYNLLLDLVKSKKDYFVVTSNVDGAFQKVGFPDDKMYEIHGRINKFQCTCCNSVWVPDSDTKFDVNPEDLTIQNELPTCPDCGAIARPNIMMFNDFTFNETETNTQEKTFNKFMQSYDKGDHKIVVLEFGAGTAIPSIRSIGEFIHNKVVGATLVRVNPGESQGPKGVISIPKGALEAISTEMI